MKLSVAIITYNEERNIRRCLESLRNVADEVVVVDSFSSDTTENICREFVALIFHPELHQHRATKSSHEKSDQAQSFFAECGHQRHVGKI